MFIHFIIYIGHMYIILGKKYSKMNSASKLYTPTITKKNILEFLISKNSTFLLYVITQPYFR